MNWQPIETAPKDGTTILGYEDGHIRLIAWGQGWKEGCVIKPSGPCWGISTGTELVDYTTWDDGAGKYLTAKPSHWMPLPDAPTQEPEAWPSDDVFLRR